MFQIFNLNYAEIISIILSYYKERRPTMNLGLYICSFYFIQSANKKGKEYYWDLNKPISLDENYYNDAEEFFDSFFQAHANDQQEDPDRVYYY